MTSLKLFFFNCIFSISLDPSHCRSEFVAPAVASVTAEPVVDDRGTEEVDYVKLAAELERASPLKVMDHALVMFGDDIAIAFSGSEEVALIEYARLMGRPFMVFSLDTRRLNPEMYRFFDAVEKHYDIHIKYMFPDTVEVQAMVRTKGEEGPAAAAGTERPKGLGHRAVEGPVPRHQSPNSHCSVETSLVGGFCYYLHQHVQMNLNSNHELNEEPRVLILISDNQKLQHQHHHHSQYKNKYKSRMMISRSRDARSILMGASVAASLRRPPIASASLGKIEFA